MNYLTEMSKSGYTSENISDFHYTMIPWLFRKYGIGLDATILDIGSGQGHGFIPLVSNGWKNIIAVDKYEDNFPIFKDKYAITTIQTDICNGTIPLESESVDAIICFHLIEHLENYDNFMLEISRLLKPNGFVFLVTPDWQKQFKTFYRDPTHIRPYDKMALCRLFRMYDFEPQSFSWGSAFGGGKFKLYRFIKSLGLIGSDLLIVATKHK